MTDRIIIGIEGQRGTVYEGEGGMENWQDLLPVDARGRDAYGIKVFSLNENGLTIATKAAHKRPDCDGGGYRLQSTGQIYISPQNIHHLEELLSSEKRH